MQSNSLYYIMFRVMVLNTLAMLLGVFFTGTLALIGIGFSLLMGEAGSNPIGIWIGASITFALTIVIAWKFIPAYNRQKKREELDDGRQPEAGIQTTVISKGKDGKPKTELR